MGDSVLQSERDVLGIHPRSARIVFVACLRGGKGGGGVSLVLCEEGQHQEGFKHPPDSPTGRGRGLVRGETDTTLRLRRRGLDGCEAIPTDPTVKWADARRMWLRAGERDEVLRGWGSCKTRPLSGSDSVRSPIQVLSRVRLYPIRGQRLTDVRGEWLAPSTEGETNFCLIQQTGWDAKELC